MRSAFVGVFRPGYQCFKDTNFQAAGGFIPLHTGACFPAPVNGAGPRSKAAIPGLFPI